MEIIDEHPSTLLDNSLKNQLGPIRVSILTIEHKGCIYSIREVYLINTGQTILYGLELESDDSVEHSINDCPPSIYESPLNTQVSAQESIPPEEEPDEIDDILQQYHENVKKIKSN